MYVQKRYLNGSYITQVQKSKCPNKKVLRPQILRRFIKVSTRELSTDERLRKTFKCYPNDKTFTSKHKTLQLQCK